MSGTLHLVGVGPGDPELLTLRAVRVLAAARLVAYPEADSGAALARDIATPHLAPDAEHLPIALPMSIARAPAQAAYDEAAATLLARLRAGDDAVFLCEGDPLFYGSAMYLLARPRAQSRSSPASPRSPPPPPPPPVPPPRATRS